MSPDTARRCVDFALENLPEGKTLGLGFFGGEPLLRFDLVRKITSYSLINAAERQQKVEIGITTNGTLVTDDVIDFAEDNNINLCFSIDGPAELHDRNRTYADGRGSFHDVMSKLEKALGRLNTVEVNAVFGPATVLDLPLTLRFFLDLGVSVVHFNPDITANWPRELCEKLGEVYRQLSETYAESYAKGREIAVNIIDSKAILFIKGGYAAADMCAMGDGEWGFAPSGNIYPCERFIGDDTDLSFCLGNIHSGLNPERRCSLRHKRGNQNEDCMACSLLKYCMNWCGCTNYFMSGCTDMHAPTLCAMEKASINAAKMTFDSLVEAGNELFIDHMFKYTLANVHHR